MLLFLVLAVNSDRFQILTELHALTVAAHSYVLLIYTSAEYFLHITQQPSRSCLLIHVWLSVGTHSNVVADTKTQRWSIPHRCRNRGGARASGLSCSGLRSVLIHENGSAVKNREGLGAFITWIMSEVDVVGEGPNRKNNVLNQPFECSAIVLDSRH